MDRPWNVNLLCMGPPWTHHGLSTEVLLTVHGHAMAAHGPNKKAPWTVHGLFIDSPWTHPGSTMDHIGPTMDPPWITMDCPRTVHGPTVDPAWTVHGPTMGHAMDRHGLSKAHYGQWTIHGQIHELSMDPPWRQPGPPWTVNEATMERP